MITKYDLSRLIVRRYKNSSSLTLFVSLYNNKSFQADDLCSKTHSLATDLKPAISYAVSESQDS